METTVDTNNSVTTPPAVPTEAANKDQIFNLVMEALQRPEARKLIFEHVAAISKGVVVTAKTPKKVVRTKTTKQTAPTKVKQKRSTVEPTRGRFQLFDIKELSAPFSDASGRTFVNCKYADGTNRVYSLETIIKNKAPLAQILGQAPVTKVVGR